MSKRLTDTSKWTNNRWFQRLPSKYKLLWLYIWDICDSAGVWSADFDLAMRMTGCTYTEDETREWFGNHIEVLDEETKTWWLMEFCRKQYKLLDETSKSQWVITNIELLKEHGLWGRYKGYMRGIYTPIEKKGKEKKGQDIDTRPPIPEEEHAKIHELINGTSKKMEVDV